MNTIADPKDVKQMTRQELLERLELIEDWMNQYQTELKRLSDSQEKMGKDMRFYELMLLEEYHMLLQLLEREKGKVWIHSK